MEYAKKMVLVSPEVINSIKDRSTSTESNNTSKLDDELKQTLEKRDITPYDKSQLYNQILQRYMMYFNKSTKTPISLQLIDKNDKQANSESLNKDSDESKSPLNKKDKDVLLNNFPVSLIKKGHSILDLIQNSNGSLDWNQQGELIKDGQTISGSHISDLLYDVMQSNRGGFEPLGWDIFLEGLVKLNVPERLISNVNRRRKLQQIKQEGVTPTKNIQEDYESSSITKRTKKRGKKNPPQNTPGKRIGRLNWETYK